MRYFLVAVAICCSIQLCAAADHNSTNPNSVSQNFLLGPVVRYFRIESGVPRRVEQVSILDFPLIAQETYSQYWYTDDMITSNPLASPKYQDFPIFLLFKTTRIKGDNARKTIASRTRLIEIPFGISFFRNDSLPGESHSGLLNVTDEIALFRRHKLSGEQFTNEYFRLPFIGPLFASWRVIEENSNYSRATIFPRLFARKSFKY